MEGKGKMSLVLVKMSLRCLRDVWPEVSRSFEAVTYEYERRLRDMEKISFLRENVYGKTCEGVVRRGRKEMRSDVEKAKEKLCKQNKVGCTSPPCTVLKVVHGTCLGGTILNEDYVNGGF